MVYFTKNVSNFLALSSVITECLSLVHLNLVHFWASQIFVSKAEEAWLTGPLTLPHPEGMLTISFANIRLIKKPCQKHTLLLLQWPVL